jgi:TfoX/Sxy family transcriptional regulator of competence genes
MPVSSPFTLFARTYGTRRGQPNMVGGPPYKQELAQRPINQVTRAWNARRRALSPAASAALGRLAGVAYDQELAGRIRRLIANAPDLTEKQMFGGLAFLIGGNMAIAASNQGGAMVRVDPQQSDALVATTTARLVQMRGRPMPGWLQISSDDLLTDDQLTPWVARGRKRGSDQRLRRPRIR